MAGIRDLHVAGTGDRVGQGAAELGKAMRSWVAAHHQCWNVRERAETGARVEA